MTGLAAVFSLDPHRDVTPLVTKLLSTIRHRGPEIFVTNGVETIQLGPNRSKQQLSPSSLCLGFCTARGIGCQQYPASIEDGFLFVDGERCVLGSSATVAPVLRWNTPAIMVKDQELIVFRGKLCFKPLYYAFSNGVFAVSSEKKGLWAIGMVNARLVPAGWMVRVGRWGVKHLVVDTLDPPRVQAWETGLGVANQIVRSVERCVKKFDRVGILFSGGLDSSIIAKVVADRVPTTLFTVSINGEREDLEKAESVACELEADFFPIFVSLDEFEVDLGHILYTAETSNLLDLGVATPIYYASKEAGRRGFQAVLLGQGADELYGGYYRYSNIFERFGDYGVLGVMLFHDLVKLFSDVVRDEIVVAAHGLEACFPYLDPEHVCFAMNIDPRLKVGEERKIILRKAAQTLGVPEKAVERGKKAVQYGSGSHKAIKQLAKKHGFTAEKSRCAGYGKRFVQLFLDKLAEKVGVPNQKRCEMG